MFKIYDGREHFYQWDLNQKLIIEDETMTQVHFCNKTDDCALVCEIYSENGLRLVNVPNILFQSDWRIKVWGYCEDYTKHEATFKVCSRSKPSDYIYTETEVKNYADLEERIAELEKSGGGGTADLTGYVKFTDIANATTPGVVKVVASTGVGIGGSQTLCIIPATEAEIDRRDNIKPITTNNLEYAVKSVGDSIYASASVIGDIDAALTNILETQYDYMNRTMSLRDGGEEQ